MEKIEFKKTNSIPASKGVGRMQTRTTECIKELASMEVGEIVHIPISEQVTDKTMQARVQDGYVGSLDTARKNLLPRKFKIARRGMDIFVERLPN